MNRTISHTPVVDIGCENFRRWLQRIRIENNETQGELANRVDLERKSVMAYESGKRIPQLDRVFKIAEHYGLKEITFKLSDLQDSER